MYPLNDIICNILRTSFSRWKDDDKRDVLICGRPTESLAISAKKGRKALNVIILISKELGLQTLNGYTVVHFCKNYFVDRLKNELGLLYADESYRNISREKMLQILNENKDIFTEAYKLFSLIFTIPSTSVSVERSFSCLKRVKTYTRNTVPQDGLFFSEHFY